MPIEPRANRPGAGIVPLVLACIFFLAAGQAFLPLLGIEYDEVLFVEPIYRASGAIYSYDLGPWHLPVMLISYLGALKTYLFGAIFSILGNSVWTLREPAVLLGMGSILSLFFLLRRVAGPVAAAVGACLLATDACYLLTATFDWGPVAVQHFLITTGALLFVRFVQGRSESALAAAFFLFGLAVWDKALALWLLGGMALAAVVVVPSVLRRLLTTRRIVIALMAGGLGMFPLILYNVHFGGETLVGNAGRDLHDLNSKALLLKNTASGQALFGYFTEEGLPTPRPGRPKSALDRVAAGLADATGHQHHSVMPWAILLAVLLAPFAGFVARRVAAFCLIAGGLAWFAMASTAGAGGSVHHTILLWPLPQLLVATVLAGVAARFVRAGRLAVFTATCFVALSGVLVLTEYYSVMLNRGGALSWTDAVFSLDEDLVQRKAPKIYCVDWGTFDPLLFLSDGKLALNLEPSGPAVASSIQEPGSVFVTHVEALRFFRQTDEKLDKAAADAGYRRRVLKVVDDSFGRHIFEVYAFERGSAVF